MTEKKTFTLTRGRVDYVTMIESQNDTHYSVSIAFENKPLLRTFGGFSEERFNFFRAAMKDGVFVVFPDLPEYELHAYYNIDMVYRENDEIESV